jgi:hypothetical protein
VAPGDGNHTVIDQNGFDSGVTGSGWVDANGNPVTSETTLAGDGMMGTFAGESTLSEQVTKTYNFDPDTTKAKLSFDFVKVDSWDNGWGGEQDHFGVYLNGELAFTYTPDGTENNPEYTVGGGDGLLERIPFSFESGGVTYTGTYSVKPQGIEEDLNGSGGSSWTEEYYRVSIILDDPPDELTLGIGAELNSDINNESWGLDDVKVAQICFANGTHIETAYGAKRVEDLKVGDLVETLHHGYQPIRWIGKNTVQSRVLRKEPKLRPIRVRKNAFGAGLPARDLRVSPQHRLLARSRIAEKMFDEADVLLPAHMLTELPNIEVSGPAKEVTYFHLMFDAHEIIFAEGLPAESLYAGPEALATISPDALEELLTLFPELKEGGSRPEPAAHLAPRGRIRTFLARHMKNRKPLIA